ncbi:MAG: glutathione peroxidase [Hyphomonadaceae bacterium]
MASAHDFTFKKLNADGDLSLADYAGKAVLVVNVASACGLTPQYRDLQALYDAKAESGLVIVGAPCNDFGAQEAGSELEIATFCEGRYNVTFPMTGKVHIVSREARHPFYQWIAGELGEDALPKWNFHKYLIGRDGALVDGFSSKTPPLALELTGAIEKTLA